jgi:hypothetical protein
MNMSKAKPIQYHEPNIESNQDHKTGTSTDWHLYSNAIKLLILLNVILFIGLAIREKIR